MVKISALRFASDLVRRTLPGILALSLLVWAGAAQAQSLQPVQHPLSIKIGALFPTNSSASDNSGNAQIDAGLDYAFGKTGSVANPALPSIYLDYFGGSRNGGHVDTVALGVAIREYANTPSGNNRQAVSPYLGFGLGGYFTDIKNTRGFFTRSGSNLNFGGKIMGGVEFSGNYFVEANYQFVPSNHGVNPSGLGIQVGGRF